MENSIKKLPSAGCRVVWHGARVWCCDGVVIFTNYAPVAQLDQSVWLRTRRSGVRISPGAPLKIKSLQSVTQHLQTDFLQLKVAQVAQVE
ncbi:MAG: hypothetical protein QOJ41_877 [Acidobacteriaceae bacterium]|jgi:hypothetical protein|nr:hypothetical protein [Acidobacteriaceae bacterium]